MGAQTPPAPPAAEDDAPFQPNAESLVPTEPEAPPGPKYLKVDFPDIAPGVPAMPFLIAVDKDAVAAADADIGGIYYILGKQKQNNGETGTKFTDWWQPTIYKRVRTSTGDGLVPMTWDADRIAMLEEVKETYNWSLPSIPWELVSKMEYFFRAVHKEHRSEGILMLTYDSTFADSEDPGQGWGIFAPEQENSAGHCKYIPESIAEHKPPHVDIVGSCHSHPEMSAYASHTDAGDQFNNDGLHITCGWKGNKTEWHVEYQMANKRITVPMEQVFGGLPTIEHDVTDMLANVKKAPVGNYSGVTTTTSSGARTAHQGSGSRSYRAPTGAPDARIYGLFYREQWNEKRATGCPDIVKNIVVALVLPDEVVCPTCGCDFDEYTPRNRRCTKCFTYLSFPEDDGNLEAIVKSRTVAYGDKVYIPGLEFLVGERSLLPVKLFYSDTTNTAISTTLWDPDKHTPTAAAKEDGSPKALPSKT